MGENTFLSWVNFTHAVALYYKHVGRIRKYIN